MFKVVVFLFLNCMVWELVTYIGLMISEAGIMPQNSCLVPNFSGDSPHSVKPASWSQEPKVAFICLPPFLNLPLAVTSPGNTFERISLKFCLTSLIMPSIRVATSAFESLCLGFCEKMVMGPSLGNQSFLI